MSSDSVLAPAPADIRFDDGRHPRAKIGYVLLATEQTVQDDVLTLSDPGRLPGNSGSIEQLFDGQLFIE